MYGLFHRASKAAVALPHVHFRPWVGSGYERGIAGRKVLVLGESHYCARPEDDVPGRCWCWARATTVPGRMTMCRR